MGVTMRDLGKRLGVSAVTVSKALAGKSGVSEEMRQKIIQLAAELGYVNPNAQQPRTAKGLDVGILVPDQFFSNDTFYAMFYKQLMQMLTDAGHFGMLELISEGMQNSMTLPNIVRSNRVDALILLGQPTEKYTQMLVNQPLPVVALDFYYGGLKMDAIIGDSAYGAAMLTYHLLEKGHRDVGYFGNPKATSSIMERYLGFVSAMTMREAPIRAECVVKDRDENNVMLEPVLPEKLPTAFVCNCDVGARTLIDVLRRRGARVPEDVSVVSYDDFNNVPGSMPLTPFRVNTAAMCQMAVKLVEERCAGDTKPVSRIVVGGECIYRDSVCPIN